MGKVKLLKASAGSGKTFQLAYEYVSSVIAEPWQYRHILAVTFTNKATEEMKRRIIAEINSLAQGQQTQYTTKLISDLSLSPETIKERALAARTKILHDYSNFSILTIDKFFQRIIRSFIRELGIDLNFNLELRTETLLSSAADSLIDEVSLDEQLKLWITGFVEEKIEENRRWEVKSELVQLGGEIFREDYRRSSATHIAKDELAAIVSKASAQAFAILGQIRKTAAQALDIITANSLCVSDFAGGSRSFANYFSKCAAGAVAAPGVTVMAAIESADKWYAKSSARKEEIIELVPQLQPLLREIVDTYTKSCRFLNSVELLRTNYRNFALLTDLAQKVEMISAAESILPISETNNILHKLISGNDTPFIFEKAGNHFNRFMIDEFQDTSTMQWENFLPLLKNAVSQSDSSPVLLVGDIKQSIYRWRGGDWRILGGEIEKEFGALLSIDLTTNYRSFGNIVTFNNNIVGRCVELDNARLNTELAESANQGLIDSRLAASLTDTLQSAYSNHSQKSVKGEGLGNINIVVYDKGEGDDGSSQAVPPVIRYVEELQQRGYSAGDIAILVRTRSEGITMANLLLEQKKKNPDSQYNYDVVTQEALLLKSSPVVAFVVACFKLAAMRSQTVNLAIYNRWLERPVSDNLPEEESLFFDQLRLKSIEEAFESVMTRFSLNTNRNDIPYLQALHDQIISFASTSISDMRLFLRWWDENGGSISVNVPQNDSSISVSTIHKSKGLQYKVVILPYCNWSLNPHPRSIIWADGTKTADGLTAIPVAFGEKMKNSDMSNDYYRELVMSHVDNMNLFYVAVTRAMEELYIMAPADKKRREDRINTLVLDTLTISDEGVKIGDMAGHVVYEEAETVYGFGSPLIREPEYGEAGQKIYTSFGSYDISNRLKLKLHMERYVDEGGELSLSPRNYGILMHRAFQNAENADDIRKEIVQMRASGILDQAEEEHLNDIVNQAFANPLVRSWFGGEWQMVRNENDIIVPGSSSMRRPDRVMIRDSRAVIVDYKFGLTRSGKYRKQMDEYAQLLERMGYAVDAYIWYFSLNDIEKVI